MPYDDSDTYDPSFRKKKVITDTTNQNPMINPTAGRSSIRSAVGSSISTAPPSTAVEGNGFYAPSPRALNRLVSASKQADNLMDSAYKNGDIVHEAGNDYALDKNLNKWPVAGSGMTPQAQYPRKATNIGNNMYMQDSAGNLSSYNPMIAQSAFHTTASSPGITTVQQQPDQVADPRVLHNVVDQAGNPGYQVNGMTISFPDGTPQADKDRTLSVFSQRPTVQGTRMVSYLHGNDNGAGAGSAADVYQNARESLLQEINDVKGHKARGVLRNNLAALDRQWLQQTGTAEEKNMGMTPAEREKFDYQKEQDALTNRYRNNSLDAMVANNKADNLARQQNLDFLKQKEKSDTAYRDARATAEDQHWQDSLNLKKDNINSLSLADREKIKTEAGKAYNKYRTSFVPANADDNPLEFPDWLKQNPAFSGGFPEGKQGQGQNSMLKEMTDDERKRYQSSSPDQQKRLFALWSKERGY